MTLYQAMRELQIVLALILGACPLSVERFRLSVGCGLHGLR